MGFGTLIGRIFRGRDKDIGGTPVEIVQRQFKRTATNIALLLQERLSEASIGPDRWSAGGVSLGYLTPPACSANFTATKNRLRNPTNFADRPLFPTVPHGVKQAEALVATGFQTSGSQHVRWTRPRHPCEMARR